VNYSTLILDHLDEISAGTAEHFQKTAGVKAITPPDDISRLDDDDFALVIVKEGALYRKFPVSSQANTLCSKEAFLRNKHRLTMDAADTAESRIKIACSRFRVPTDGLSERTGTALSPYILHTKLATMEYEIRQARQHMEKTASMAKFAVHGTLNGHEISKFPINTPEQIKRASEDISTKIPANWFIKGAQVILAAAKVANVDIDPLQEINIVKNAEISPAFQSEIYKRMKLTGGPAALQYIDLQKSASDSDMASVAVALENLDVTNGLRYKWGSALRTPAFAVYGMPKQADVVEMDGQDIDENNFVKLVEGNEDKIKSALGEAATEGLKSTPKLSYRALPAPHKQFLSELMSGTA